jgi:hypothetical protein
LRIFETFPEGIALIRNNYIMYANKSLKNILEVHTDVLTNSSPEKNKNDLLKRQLMETKIIPYVSGGTNNKKGGSMASGLPSSTSNIW